MLEYNLLFVGLIIVLSALLFGFAVKQDSSRNLQWLFLYFVLNYLFLLLGFYLTSVPINAAILALGLIEGPIIYQVILFYAIGKPETSISKLHYLPSIAAIAVFITKPEATHELLYLLGAVSRVIYAAFGLTLLIQISKEAGDRPWFAWGLLLLIYAISVSLIKIYSTGFYFLDGDWATPTWLVLMKTTGASLIIITMLWWALIKPDIYSVSDTQAEKQPRIATNAEKDLHGRLISLLHDKEIYTDLDINLARTSEMLSVSERELSNAVNRVAGQGFRSLLRQYRINKACELIKNNKEDKLSVLDISLSSGFASKSVFNLAFKKETGMTPSEYRSTQAQC